MKKIFIYILLFFIGGNCFLKSQELPVHEQYMFDWVLANPAFVGLSEATSFKLIHREQWIGIDNAPRTSLLSFKRRIPNWSGGYGGYLYSDRNGPSFKHGFQLSKSFQVLLRSIRYDQLILSFGISFKGYYHILDETQFEQYIYDPIIDYNKKSSFVPNSNFGLILSYNNFFVGFSGDNLFQYNDKMYDFNYEPIQRVFFNFHSGVAFDIVQTINFPKVEMRPSVLLKTDMGGLNQLDVNCKFQLYSGKPIRSVFIRYSNEIWFALSYKQTLDKGYSAPLAFSPSFGFAINSFTFAYLYNIGLTSLQFYHGGTHQLSIGFRFFPDKYERWSKHQIPYFIDNF